MGRDLNIYVRHYDGEHKEILTSDRVKDYLEQNPGQNFNDFAFMDPNTHANLIIDARDGAKPKYAFVWNDQVLDTKQYMAVLPQNWEANMTASMRMQRAENISFLEQVATLMTREEAREFINHDYGIRDMRAERSAYFMDIAKSGLSEAEYRVDYVSRHNPEPADRGFSGYIMLNGEYTNVHTDALRNRLQGSFEPGSPERSDPSRAIMAFVGDGNIHWNHSRTELTISANHPMTPDQKATLSDIISQLNNDERKELVVNVYNQDIGKVDQYDGNSRELERISEDAFGILNPMFKTHKREDFYHDFGDR